MSRSLATPAVRRLPPSVVACRACACRPNRKCVKRLIPVRSPADDRLTPAGHSDGGRRPLASAPPLLCTSEAELRGSGWAAFARPCQKITVRVDRRSRARRQRDGVARKAVDTRYPRTPDRPLVLPVTGHDRISIVACQGGWSRRSSTMVRPDGVAAVTGSAAPTPPQRVRAERWRRCADVRTRCRRRLRPPRMRPA